MSSSPGAPKKMSKREFLVGAVAGGVAFQAARMIAPSAFGGPSTEPHQISYAQSGEDLIVAFMFQYLKLPHPTYIDIGAWKPIDGSNTYYFYKRGCRGVLVEPNVDLIGLLKKERPGDTVLNFGIGVDTVKEADYYRMTDSALNTFSKEEADHVVRETAGNVKIEEVVKMPLVNVNEVLDEHFKGGAPDFLSIDVEGLDLSILKTLDYKKHRPKVICVETIVMGTTREIPEINQFLLSKGYVLRGSSFVNAIFIDKPLLDRNPFGSE
jgi:FkbM family methyltransferase